jgi:hypothetical protein
MTLFEGHGTSRTMLNLKDGFDINRYGAYR